MRKLIVTGLVCCIALFIGCSAGEVVVYTTVDKAVAEPLFNTFTEKTGIVVQPQYGADDIHDKLLAEKGEGKADIFWNASVAGTIDLRIEGVLESYKSQSFNEYPEQYKDSLGYWTAFSAQSRVILFNKSLVDESLVPRSVYELTGDIWLGKVAVEKPISGNSLLHMTGLCAVIGKRKTEQLLETMLETKFVFTQKGNSVGDLVAAGTVPVGITDMSDAHRAMQKNSALDVIFPDKGMGTILIPHTVALIADAPNRDNGVSFIDYLLTDETESSLAYGNGALIPLRGSVDRPDYLPLVDDLSIMYIDFIEAASYKEKFKGFTRKLLK
ncbi:MAG: extracellular solute-binding protein [Fibrobacterales bacterium]